MLYIPNIQNVSYYSVDTNYQNSIHAYKNICYVLIYSCLLTLLHTQNLHKAYTKPT